MLTNISLLKLELRWMTFGTVGIGTGKFETIENSWLYAIRILALSSYTIYTHSPTFNDSYGCKQAWRVRVVEIFPSYSFVARLKNKFQELPDVK